MPLFWFAAKVGFLLFMFIWVRGTLPRFRYDQLMHFAWTFLFPSRMVNLLLTGFLVALFYEIDHGCDPFLDLRGYRGGLRLNLVVQTHPISSALSLIGVMGSLAVLYLLLGAEFIAAAQMIVYAGAIMVLFMFVIMLLNAGAEEDAAASPGSRRLLGIPLLALSSA